MSGGDLPLDDWLITVCNCKALPEEDMKKLCRHVTNILIEEANVQNVSAPVTICGDIHGQFFDLLELFRQGGQVQNGEAYIFMGDLVDRGNHSLEVLTLLLLLKARWPDRITLLRGNHESRQVTKIYGFYDECSRKYGCGAVWKLCSDLFDLFTLAALIENSILCLHGGLSPDIRTLDQIRVLDRVQEIPNEGPFCDLVWSDPDTVDTWAQSPRGAGWLFGARVTYEFTSVNKLSLMCRAHQLVQEGHKFHFEGENLVTVWSAPNYVYRCGNLASILKIGPQLEREFITFREVEDQGAEVPSLNSGNPIMRRFFM
eukprot:NODE_2439_length_1117_cov_8.786517_g2025_i0.p1 GENE.NODE_2439_length_1117_cov_8.786517_g2025_i0~~NODE_2439_length_1117_cov_8.786517_g2025_i0.p1  ORF type:complete len:345 (+),score=60.57 NODE_2439_length_1117_cov_8.786517_g2025_i0:91-1035(+)